MSSEIVMRGMTRLSGQIATEQDHFVAKRTNRRGYMNRASDDAVSMDKSAGKPIDAMRADGPPIFMRAGRGLHGLEQYLSNTIDDGTSDATRAAAAASGLGRRLNDLA